MKEWPLNQERRDFRLYCPERMDVAEQAVLDLAETMRILGINKWMLPNIREKFVVAGESEFELGKVGRVTNAEAEIVYDEKFRTKKSQEQYEEKLRAGGLDYPGMEQTFKHELAHLVMWSVTGMRHQAAVRILDEGWATIVEQLGSGDSHSVAELVEGLRIKVKGLKIENQDVYEKCLDLEHPVSQLVKEDLGNGEYIVGAALLLWVREIKGQDAMIDLLRKSPATSRRTSTDTMKVPADLRPDLHAGYQAYQKGVVDPIRRGSLSAEEMVQISDFARKWEAAQFRSALLGVTGFSSIAEVRQKFEEWLS